MRSPIFGVCLAACVLMLSAPASAQTSVTFDHVDYASAARYEGGYFAQVVTAGGVCDTASAPATTATALDNLAKPATTTGVGMSAPLVAKPIGCYVYKVRAYDVSGLVSEWSAPSDPFSRKPATPGKPVVK